MSGSTSFKSPRQKCCVILMLKHIHFTGLPISSLQPSGQLEPNRNTLPLPNLLPKSVAGHRSTHEGCLKQPPLLWARTLKG